MSAASWLPKLIRLSDHNGKWDAYVDAVYDVFESDFIRSVCLLNGQRVGVRRQPSHDNKWFTFWHCASEGPVEEHRTPDLRRCERIPWMRPIVEHETEGVVDVWQAKKGREERRYVWYSEEYLVVLGVRKDHYLLITAFPTDREHTRKKLRQERDSATP